MSDLCIYCHKEIPNGMRHYQPEGEACCIAVPKEVNVNTTDWLFNESEIKALYRLIKHQYLNREDDELIEVTNRIMKINDDILRRDNQAT